MSRYEGDYIDIYGCGVHYDTFEMYVKHIHSHQGIDRDDVGSIMGWDMLRANLHDYVFRTIEEPHDYEWGKQFEALVESFFVCNMCGKVPAYFDWYCKECDEFVSIGDVMWRLKKYKMEHLCK